MHAACRFEADFKRISARFWQISSRVRSGILAESCGFLAESFPKHSGFQAQSIYALPVLDCMRHAGSWQISNRFQLDFRQISGRVRSGILADSWWNLSGIVPEWFRNPSGINAQSIYFLPVLDCMRHAGFRQVLGRLQPDFRQISSRVRSGILAESYRNLSGIVPESFRNRSEILAEPMRNLSMPYPCLIACVMQVFKQSS